MKTQFKILLLMLITSAMSYSQSHQILKRSVEVDKNTSIVLNFDNIYVAIEESTDGKIHFDYSLEFDGYSKKDVQKQLDMISAKVTNFDNGVTLKAKSDNQITFERIQFTAAHGISIDERNFNSKKDTIIRKSKDSLLIEIKKNNKLDWKGSSLKYINERFKRIGKDGKLSNFRKGNMDIMRSQFIIKIPPFVKININAKNSGIYFRNDVSNEMSVKLNSGKFIGKILYNAYNRIKIEDANVEVEAIFGGDFDFKNVKNGKIGSVQNTKIKSEFSKVEIGEIDKNTTITDFNSEYWFYNWSTDFERFYLYSEYSKIHFFYPKLDFSLKVIGNNTKSFLGNDVIINMQPTSKGEKYTMMTNDAEDPNKVSGNIYFDIIHGIIYSNDFLLTTLNGSESKN